MAETDPGHAAAAARDLNPLIAEPLQKKQLITSL